LNTLRERGIEEYSNGTLSAVHHPEGRLAMRDNFWIFEYFLKDHLGNTRVVFSDLNYDGAISLTLLLFCTQAVA